MHEVRRSEARLRKGTPEATALKGWRWALPKAPERHTDEDRPRLAEVSRSQLAPFVKLARTLRKHRDGILAAIELGVSNGRMEGIQSGE